MLTSRLFDELDTERIACITGVLSGGKTRLAFEIALHYWRMGYRIISNVPHNFIDNEFTQWKTKQGLPGLLGSDTLANSLVIIDEGGEYVRKASLGSAISRSAAKADYYILFSGKRLPHKDMASMIIKPRFDFFQNFGIPVILWRSLINATDKYKFPVWQINPQRMHGTYSTLTSTSGIEDIISRALLTVHRLAQIEGQQAGKTEEAGIEGFADDLASASDGAISVPDV